MVNQSIRIDRETIRTQALPVRGRVPRSSHWVVVNEEVASLREVRGSCLAVVKTDENKKNICSQTKAKLVVMWETG